MYKHILIPTDGSDLSRSAALSGVRLARALGAKVTAFFAAPAATPDGSTNWSASNYAATVKPRITWNPPSNMPPSRVVDHFLELAWKLDRIEPARGIDDFAFARRLYLDLAGRIPTAQEAAVFVRTRGKDKRAQLIETLLAGDESSSITQR